MKFGWQGVWVIAGMMLAGYLQYGEILLEWIVVTAFLFHTAIPIIDRADRGPVLSPVRFVRNWIADKTERVRSILYGDHPGPAILRIMLAGLAFGWAVTLVWLFAGDWKYGVSRGLVETLLIVIIFFPAYLVFRNYFRGERQRIAREQEKERKAVAEAREQEDRILSEPDEDDYGPPVGMAYGAIAPPDPKERIQMQYFTYPTKNRYPFGLPGIEDIREDEDETLEEVQREARRRAFLIGIYFVITLGLLPFMAGFILSGFHSLDITSFVGMALFGPH